MQKPRPYDFASAPVHMLAPYDEPSEDGESGRAAGLPRHVPIYLPELYPIPDAQEFNPSGTTASAAIAAGTIALAPAVGQDAGVITIPPNNIGIIRGFTISITNMLVTTNVTFSLLVNGATAGGYGVLSITPRATSYVGNSFDCFVRVPNNAKITVAFNNIDGGTYVLGASVSGWYWPLTSGVRWLQEGS